MNILRIEGNVDFTTYKDLEEKLTKLVDDGAVNILLNLEDLNYLASAGLRVLLKCALRVKPLGGSISMCCANETVKEVIEIAGFDGIFKMFDTEVEALK